MKNNKKTWYYSVKKSEHNNENGTYITHIQGTDENNSNCYGGFGIDIK